VPKGDGTATMLPTENHFTFGLAKELGCSVGTLLLGGTPPMSNMELYLWQRWNRAEARIEQQSSSKRKR
jgi:hypothetical protein